MIRNQWYVVLESNEVKVGKPLGVTRLGEKMVFWRTAAGKIACIGDVCAHIGAPLCLGKLKDDAIVCPFHGFEYDTSGQCRFIPSLGKNGIVPKAIGLLYTPIPNINKAVEAEFSWRPPKIRRG